MPSSAPQAAPHASSSHPARQADRAAQARLGRLILLAEDDPVTQEVTGLQLAGLGHAWDVASDGIEALRMLHARQYGLVLTDMRMRGLDGTALAREIRRAGLRNLAGRRLPVIVLSADPQRPALAPADVDAWLTKPVPQETLAACLRQWLPAGAA